MKDQKCIVGFDFGTTSLSVVVFDVENCQIVKVLNYNTDAYIELENSYQKEQSIEKISSFFRKALNEIQSIAHLRIVAYAFTGQMHGIIGLNKDGAAVTNLVTWQDRSGEIRTPDGSTLLDEIRQTTGVDTLVNGYGIVTLYKWIKVDNRTDIHTFCTVPDYFARTLITEPNEEIAITPTMAHSVGLYDLYTDRWQADLIHKLGLSDVSFPHIVDPSTPIGYVSNQGHTIPVFCAIGDNQASFGGSVIDKQRTILLNVGTGTQLSFLVHKSEINKYTKYVDGFETQVRPYNADYYLLATSFLNGGSVYKSLFNFYKDVAQNLFNLKDIDEALLWQRMMAMGEEALAKDDTLVVNPLLEGQRKDPSLGGTISNLHTSNFTSGNFVAAFLKGLVEYYKTGLYPEVAASVTYICGSGNGLKRNPLFCRLIESSFGCQLQLTTYNEEAALGAILNAYEAITTNRADQILNKLNNLA